MSDTALLIFARCVGFVFRAPGFSHPDVPPPLRAGFAFVLALALERGVHERPAIPGGGFVAAVASEALVGAAMGTAASLLYDGAFSGGRALDDYVGIRASVPSADVAAGAGFGRLWSLAFATGFFVLGGDRIALAALARTFASLPPGALVDAHGLRTFALALPQTLARAALFVAGPALLVALLAQVGLAVVARLVPRFSTFSLAFGVVFAGALLATVATLPALLQASARPWMDLAPLQARR
jgi:flagellar biosynthetic protein FliR